MLHFTNFQKSYDSSPIISIPQLSLPDGVYWLQGENGAGKTTLLKCIAGLIPFTGEIRVDDMDIRKHRIAYRKGVNWADAEPVYPAFLTGLDLISFYEQTLSSTPAEISRLIKAFGVDHYIKKKVGTYSSGMTKKLSLVLGFMGSPKWVLLDEPLITLDVAVVKTCLQLISNYEKKGISFLISSHQPFMETAAFPIKPLTIENKTLLMA
jgi:ABC-2 type transport system ATP-binding protein